MLIALLGKYLKNIAILAIMRFYTYLKIIFHCFFIIRSHSRAEYPPTSRPDAHFRLGQELDVFGMPGFGTEDTRGLARCFGKELFMKLVSEEGTSVAQS